MSQTRKLDTNMLPNEGFNKPSPDGWRLCVAPMMDWTDRHCRYFHRLLAPHARLYTEMVTSAALIHGPRDRLLAHNQESPLALQLGGSQPDELAQAASMGETAGYDEINLNVGCPSARVKSGRFGACLMLEPKLVASCVKAMQRAVRIPVTVKCRIGVDDQDAWHDLQTFTRTMCDAGVNVLEVHARKAWLEGLSPKENRNVPPLDYARVYKLKASFPELRIIINGGIDTVTAAIEHLAHVDGVMLGRSAYRHPWILAELEHAMWGTPLTCRGDVLRAMYPYLESQLSQGIMLKHMLRHVLGLFQGQPRGKVFRRILSEGMHQDDADLTLVDKALDCVETVSRAA